MDSSKEKTWKSYVLIATKFLAIFYLITLCMIIFFIHRGNDWLIQGIIISALYLFVLIVSFKKMITQLSIAAIFIAAPTVPLVMLIVVVSMIPTLQFLDKQLAYPVKWMQAYSYK